MSMKGRWISSSIIDVVRYALNNNTNSHTKMSFIISNFIFSRITGFIRFSNTFPGRKSNLLFMCMMKLLSMFNNPYLNGRDICVARIFYKRIICTLCNILTSINAATFLHISTAVPSSLIEVQSDNMLEYCCRHYSPFLN